MMTTYTPPAIPLCCCTDCGIPDDCGVMFWKWHGRNRTLPLCIDCALARVDRWQAITQARFIIRQAQRQIGGAR